MATALVATTVTAWPRVLAPTVVGERYVGAVVDSIVHASLQIASTGIEGRWAYERGSKQGLRLTTVSKGVHGFELRESDGQGVVVGELNLELAFDTWSGTWTKPGRLEGPEVRLTRELRSQVGNVSVRARPVILPYACGNDAAESKRAGFLPEVVGPGSEKLASTLTLATLLDETEDDLTSATSLDFSMPFQDARFVTFEVSEETMGAYPDVHAARRTFSWSTGRRLGLEVLLPAKREALARVLDKRVQTAWASRQREYARGDDDAGCGAGTTADFVGHVVHFDAKGLADLSLDATV